MVQCLEICILDKYTVSYGKKIRGDLVMQINNDPKHQFKGVSQGIYNKKIRLLK